MDTDTDSERHLLYFIIFMLIIVLIAVFANTSLDDVQQPETYTVTIYSENGEKLETFENVREVSEGLFSETISFWKDGKYIRFNAENFSVTQN